MWWFIGWACESASHRLTISERAVTFDGAPLVGLAEIERHPLDGRVPEIVALPLTQQPIRVDLPGDTPWYQVRALATSAAERHPAVELAVDGRRLGALRPPTGRWLPTCTGAPRAARDLAPEVRLTLQSSADGEWVVATARFAPVWDGVRTETPDACWSSSPCDAVFADADLRAACEDGAASGAPPSARLGGENGCAAPIVRDDPTRYREALTASLRRWGLNAAVDLVVSPEPEVRWATVAATLDAIAAAGLPFPVFPDGMVSGDDGPPVCNAQVRDAAGLAAASARDYGAHRTEVKP